LNTVTNPFIFYRLNLYHVKLVLHGERTEFAPGTHLGRLDIPELFPGIGRMERDLARHKIHDGRTSLFSVDTDTFLFPSIGV
jgi:hypothetical protein